MSIAVNDILQALEIFSKDENLKATIIKPTTSRFFAYLGSLFPWLQHMLEENKDGTESLSTLIVELPQKKKIELADSVYEVIYKFEPQNAYELLTLIDKDAVIKKQILYVLTTYFELQGIFLWNQNFAGHKSATIDGTIEALQIFSMQESLQATNKELSFGEGFYIMLICVAIGYFLGGPLGIFISLIFSGILASLTNSNFTKANEEIKPLASLIKALLPDDKQRLSNQINKITSGFGVLDTYTLLTLINRDIAIKLQVRFALTTYFEKQGKVINDTNKEKIEAIVLRGREGYLW